MKICPKCGASNADTLTFCTTCGEGLINQVPQYQAPQYQASQYQAPQYQAPQYQAPPVYNTYGQPVITEDMLPEELKPVSPGAYFGYSLLFGLPLIGIIMLFVVAFSTGYKKSLRNYARYILIMYLVMIVLSIFVGIIAGASVGGYYY